MCKTLISHAYKLIHYGKDSKLNAGKVSRLTCKSVSLYFIAYSQQNEIVLIDNMWMEGVSPPDTITSSTA